MIAKAAILLFPLALAQGQSPMQRRQETLVVLLAPRDSHLLGEAYLTPSTSPDRPPLILVRNDSGTAGYLVAAVYAFLVARDLKRLGAIGAATTRVRRISPASLPDAELVRARAFVDRLRRIPATGVSKVGQARALPLFLPNRRVATIARTPPG